MSRFIVVEGLDGTGKTTQIKKLAEHLENTGEKTYITAEPTDLPSGKLIRRVLSGEIPSNPWATAALFLADRIQHNTDSVNGIEAHLKNNETVISDRYYYSTFAYQGSETDLRWTMKMHFDCPQIRKPDLVIFLTMSVEKCLERITVNRPKEAIEIYENTESLTKTSLQFNKVFEMLKNDENIVFIDAFGSVDEVAARIAAAADKGQNYE